MPAVHMNIWKSYCCHCHFKISALTWMQHPPRRALHRVPHLKPCCSLIQSSEQLHQTGASTSCTYALLSRQDPPISPAAEYRNDIDIYMIYVQRHEAAVLVLCLLLASSTSCCAAAAPAQQVTSQHDPQLSKQLASQLQLNNTYMSPITGELHGGGGSAASFEWPGAGETTSKQLHMDFKLLRKITVLAKHPGPQTQTLAPYTVHMFASSYTLCLRVPALPYVGTVCSLACSSRVSLLASVLECCCFHIGTV
jgi:hypothetical protein